MFDLLSEPFFVDTVVCRHPTAGSGSMLAESTSTEGNMAIPLALVLLGDIMVDLVGDVGLRHDGQRMN